MPPPESTHEPVPDGLPDTSGGRSRQPRGELDLVRRMLAGDETAFDLFADVYLPRLHRFAGNRLGHDRELTRDMVQATVVKAIARLDSFRGESALTTWLCACCRSEIAMHFRREGRGGGPAVELDETVAPMESQWSREPLGAPERELLRAEAFDHVHEALDRLPPHYGRALEWKYIDELSVKEIAARLDMGPKAAESLLTRARNAFRDVYGRMAGTAAGSAGVGDGEP